MKLITEMCEEVEVVTEAKEGGEGKNYYLQGIFMQSGEKNRNGRLYKKEILQREVTRYIKENIKKNRAYGELGHPEGPTINLDRVSHMIKELVEDGNNFVGKALVLDTPSGKIVQEFLKQEASLGVSSRGMGSLKQSKGVQEVQDDFILATPADIVADPSAKEAFVNGIMEGREWVWDNGIVREVDIAKYHQAISGASRSDLESTQLKAFSNFIQKL
ncbi:MAG: primosomal protein [Candidatus Pacebacteria bacterium]|jgi:hypothetical protein|nr:primosomal protein [Candidatus Paceibacterota bacterium]